MNSLSSLKNHFLIAMPALGDPNFDQTISLICEHNEEGAMGIIINRVSDITLAEVFSQFNNDYKITPATDESDMALEGGPVQPEHGFVLHRPAGEWTYSLKVSDELQLTTSQDIIKAISNGEGPDDYIVTLGYAGWGAGQLEEEIAANSWLTIPVDPAIVFHYPISERRNLATATIGLNYETLSSQSGHA